LSVHKLVPEGGPISTTTCRRKKWQYMYMYFIVCAFCWCIKRHSVW